jgi:hypothetical protein
LFPIVKGNKVLALNTKEAASENTFILEVSLEGFVLSKIFEDLNRSIITLNSIGIL